MFLLNHRVCAATAGILGWVLTVCCACSTSDTGPKIATGNSQPSVTPTSGAIGGAPTVQPTASSGFGTGGSSGFGTGGSSGFGTGGSFGFGTGGKPNEAAGGTQPAVGGADAGSPTEPPTNPPNIVFFLVDDMGHQDTSEPFLYDAAGAPIISGLNQRYRTPNMEALAKQGMKFTNAYAMPVCTPTRVSLMTGKNSVRHHVTNWTNPSGTETAMNSTPAYAGPTNWERMGLPQPELTLPSLLQEAGYRTLLAGKAHFGASDYNKDPLNVGFDVNVAGSEYGHPGSYLGDYGQNSSRPVPGLEKYWDTGTFLTEALTLEMNEAIAQAVEEDVQFYAYMTHFAVHSPFIADPRFADNYPSIAPQARNFATMIEGMDKSLGDILAKLDQLGVAEDTLVVFMSDNGGDAPLGAVNNSNAPLRHKKGSQYEGGLRVPLMFAWAKPNPNHPTQAALNIQPGTVEHDIVACFDLFPTLLGVAGVPVAHAIDGTDLRPYLRGEPGTHRQQELLVHFPHDHRGDFFTVLRQEEWKLIYSYATDQFELYNLAEDISEANDLSETESARVLAMAEAMGAALVAGDAQWPTLKAGGAEDPFGRPTAD